ncbi:MAG: YqhA family protein [Roseiflexaceae bacterium]|nr:YqhA family protein [Roseiflexaceae bacterium]
MLGRIVSGSRYLIAIAVLCLFAGTVAMLVYGAIETVLTFIEAFSIGVSNTGAKTLSLNLIELADLFLIATVLYILAAGLYELFIDGDVPLLPKWLVINTLDDLKNKLVSAIIVVLAVLFLGQVVKWDGTRELLGYGIAIALVVVALTYFLSVQTRKTSTYLDRSEKEDSLAPDALK